MAKKEKESKECRKCGKDMPLMVVKKFYKCSDCGIVKTETDEFRGKGSQ